MKSEIELRPYQVKVLNEITVRFKEEKEVVLAACPSSGKTIITMKFLQNNPGRKVLILTHGTDVLRKQWRNELSEKGITASDQPGEHDICFGLPQGHRQLKALGKLDYLIIDEAHEFTFATTVQELIKTLKPKKILYLTGTPSKFIAKGYNPTIVPAIDLIASDNISDLYVGMVSTNAKLDDSSFNKDGDVIRSQEGKLEKSVDSDMDNLLTAIHKRLRETGAFKGNPTARKLAKWGPTLGKLHKTMIACSSIKQAEKVQKYFEKNKIEVLSSNNETDPKGTNIDLFISNESTVKVLIVVQRGILGFNLTDLVNVVDLTCSRNIDRIYQLYARVMRKHETYTDKYFFKFSTEEHMLVSKFYMDAALMLMFPDFISKYNGRNLNACEVLVHRPRGKRNEKSSEQGKKASTKEKTLTIDKLFYDTVKAGAMLRDIHNKIGQVENEYCYVKFGYIKNKILADNKSKIDKVTEADLLFFMKNKFLQEHCYVD